MDLITWVPESDSIWAYWEKVADGTGSLWLLAELCVGEKLAVDLVDQVGYRFFD